jgi:antitoxin CptB
MTAEDGREPARGRLAWRCRRGMKELDLLLERYLHEAFARAPAEEQAAFAALLERPDPELAAACYGNSAPSSTAEGRVLAIIRAGLVPGPC